jgi:hypothetical protein
MNGPMMSSFFSYSLHEVRFFYSIAVLVLKLLLSKE